MYQLSDLEKIKLITFSADKEMVEAVKKVLLASIYSNGTLRQDTPADAMTNAAFLMVMKCARGEGSMSDADLGQDLRALAYGVMSMESGFKKISEIKPTEIKVENTENTAI